MNITGMEREWCVARERWWCRRWGFVWENGRAQQGPGTGGRAGGGGGGGGGGGDV